MELACAISISYIKGGSHVREISRTQSAVSRRPKKSYAGKAVLEIEDRRSASLKDHDKGRPFDEHRNIIASSASNIAAIARAKDMTAVRLEEHVLSRSLGSGMEPFT